MDRLQDLRFGLDLRMAGHARLRVRHARIGCLGNRSVTVLAINAQAGDVMLVAERNRLIQRLVHLRGVGRI
jgi:hypothetical protein